MEIALEKYRKEFKIASHECNKHKEILLAAVFKHITETAWEHVKLTGHGFEENENSKFKWLLTRLNICINTLPQWQDEIILETWPSGIKANYFGREFIFLDKISGKEYIKASSDWVVIDKNTNSVCVPSELNFYEKSKYQKACNIIFDKIKSRKNAIPTAHVTAKYSDIDLHQHVNNSAYVRWIENEMGNIFPRRINTFKTQYLSEVFENDNIVIFSEKSDNVFYYECRTNADKLCFRAEVVLY